MDHLFSDLLLYRLRSTRTQPARSTRTIPAMLKPPDDSPVATTVLVLVPSPDELSVAGLVSAEGSGVVGGGVVDSVTAGVVGAGVFSVKPSTIRNKALLLFVAAV